MPIMRASPAPPPSQHLLKDFPDSLDDFAGPFHGAHRDVLPCAGSAFGDRFRRADRVQSYRVAGALSGSLRR